MSQHQTMPDLFSTVRDPKARYEVLTWDVVRQDWTPQQGVRRGPHTLWGLKRALRRLQKICYTCDYHSYGGRKAGAGDGFVTVSRI